MNRFIKKNYHIISFSLLGIIFVAWVMIQGYIYPDQTEMKNDTEISLTDTETPFTADTASNEAGNVSGTADNITDTVGNTPESTGNLSQSESESPETVIGSDESQTIDDTDSNSDYFMDEIPDDIEPGDLTDDTAADIIDIGGEPDKPEPIDLTPKSNVVLEEGTFGAGDGKMPFDLCLANVHKSLNVREAPGEDKEIIAKFLPSEYARVIEVAGEWSKITSGEVTGYAHNDYLIKDEKALKKLIDSDKLLVVITERLVNLRADKSTDADVVREAKKDETFKCIPSESDSNWFAVKNDDGNIAYVATTLAQITADMDTIDSLTPVG